MFKKTNQKGEIATVLTFLSVGMMLLGMVTGSYINNKTGIKTQTMAQQLPSGVVVMTNNAFIPGSIKIINGRTILWQNNDTVPHSVTSETPGLFDSGELQPGNSFRYTFNSAGTFNYYSKLDPGMTGTIIMQGTNDNPTPIPTDVPPTPTVPAGSRQKGQSCAISGMCEEQVNCDGFIDEGYRECAGQLLYCCRWLKPSVTPIWPTDIIRYPTTPDLNYCHYCINLTCYQSKPVNGQCVDINTPGDCTNTTCGNGTNIVIIPTDTPIPNSVTQPPSGPTLPHQGQQLTCNPDTGADCKSGSKGEKTFCYNECAPDAPGYSRPVYCENDGGGVGFITGNLQKDPQCGSPQANFTPAPAGSTCIDSNGKTYKQGEVVDGGYCIQVACDGVNWVAIDNKCLDGRIVPYPGGIVVAGSCKTPPPSCNGGTPVPIQPIVNPTKAPTAGQLFFLDGDVETKQTASGADFNFTVNFHFNGCDGDITLNKDENMVAHRGWNKGVNDPLFLLPQYTGSPTSLKNGEIRKVTYDARVDKCPNKAANGQPQFDNFTCTLAVDGAGTPRVSGTGCNWTNMPPEIKNPGNSSTITPGPITPQATLPPNQQPQTNPGNTFTIDNFTKSNSTCVISVDNNPKAGTNFSAAVGGQNVGTTSVKLVFTKNGKSFPFEGASVSFCKYNNVNCSPNKSGSDYTKWTFTNNIKLDEAGQYDVSFQAVEGTCPNHTKITVQSSNSPPPGGQQNECQQKGYVCTAFTQCDSSNMLKPSPSYNYGCKLATNEACCKPTPTPTKTPPQTPACSLITGNDLPTGCDRCIMEQITKSTDAINEKYPKSDPNFSQCSDIVITNAWCALYPNDCAKTSCNITGVCGTDFNPNKAPKLIRGAAELNQYTAEMMDKFKFGQAGSSQIGTLIATLRAAGHVAGAQIMPWNFCNPAYNVCEEVYQVNI